MRVVIDTNVLISALLWKKKLTPLYHLINQYKITLCFSKATLACAQSCGANFIISGDKHLIRLKKFQGIPIISPRKFLKYFK